MNKRLKIGITVISEDGTVSHGLNVEGTRSEILEKIEEELDDRVIGIEIKKRPMQKAPVCEKITYSSANNQSRK